jgi:hypothetical protein
MHLENCKTLLFDRAFFKSLCLEEGFEESLKASFLKLSKNSKGIVLNFVVPVVVAFSRSDKGPLFGDTSTDNNINKDLFADGF